MLRTSVVKWPPILGFRKEWLILENLCTQLTSACTSGRDWKRATSSSASEPAAEEPAAADNLASGSIAEEHVPDGIGANPVGSIMPRDNDLMMERITKKVRFHALGGGWKLDTWKYSKEADGSCTVSCGETVVEATVYLEELPRRMVSSTVPYIQVDFKGKFYSYGGAASSFYRRDTHTRDFEMLAAARLQRAMASVIPAGFPKMVYIKVHVMSADKKFDPELVAFQAASSALASSRGIPWSGPVAAVRVKGPGQLVDPGVTSPQNGTLVATMETGFGLHEQNVKTLEADSKNEFNVVVVGSGDGIVYMYGEGHEIGADQLGKAVDMGLKEIKSHLAKHQFPISRASGKAGAQYALSGADPAAARRIYSDVYSQLENGIREEPRTSIFSIGKIVSGVKENMMTSLQEKGRWRSEVARIPGSGCVTASDLDAVCSWAISEIIRKNMKDENNRIDGRKVFDYRPYRLEPGVLPKAHGSAACTLGALTTVVSAATCCSLSDNGMYEASLFGDVQKRLIVCHGYNASISPGGARTAYVANSVWKAESEISDLVEKAITPLLPEEHDVPFAFKINSDVTTSDGGDFLASLYGAQNALSCMGVELKGHIAGSSVALLNLNPDVLFGERRDVSIDANGMIEHEPLTQYQLLVDPSELESRESDAQLHVAGVSTGALNAIAFSTSRTGGIGKTTFKQMLSKAINSMKKAAKQVGNNRLKKLKNSTAKFGPVTVPKSAVGKVLGKDGLLLRQIESMTGGKIYVGEDGNFIVFGPDESSFLEIEEVLMSAAGAHLIPGRTYMAKVMTIKDYGAFVKLPGSDMEALLHISEISPQKIKSVEDELSEGQDIEVRYLGRDASGSLMVSRKAILSGDKKR